MAQPLHICSAHLLCPPALLARVAHLLCPPAAPNPLSRPLCLHALPTCSADLPRPTCRAPPALPPAGEEPHTGIVAGITPGNPTLVTTVEDERLEFQDGQYHT